MNIGELPARQRRRASTNVTGSRASRASPGWELTRSLAVARQQVENGGADGRREHGRGRCSMFLDAMTTFLSLVASEPDISRVAGDDRFVQMVGDRSGD